MSNVLDDQKQHQIRALGRLGWTLSRIQEATGMNRTGLVGGPIQREDGTHGTTQQTFPGSA